MDAKNFISGVYLDNKLFTKKETIDLMEDYHDYRIKYNNQILNKLKEIKYSYDQEFISKHQAFDRIMELLKEDEK